MSEPGRLHAFKLDRRGLARVFGELEATVMETMWALGSATVADVSDRLEESVHYKTLMTIMNRLVDKGALRRKRRSRAYVYSPAETREDFMTRVSRRVVQGLVLDFGDAAVAQMVDALEDVDPALINRLRALADSDSDAEDEGGR
jgi:predicted transcriptional regulator